MEKPFIIPVFIPHDGCPHRCAFCNQHIITGKNYNRLSLSDIDSYIHKYLTYNEKKRPSQIAFYGGNFFGLNENRTIALLELAQNHVSNQQVQSIRFSTRPDTVSLKNLDLLKPYTVKDIEVGAQSMDNSVLRKSVRGHKYEDTIKAAKLIKRHGFKLGIQLMIGLPGENSASHMVTAKKVVNIRPDFIRIYPTVVLRGSLLEKLYKRRKYRPLSLQRAVFLTKKLYLDFFHADIPVIRMGLQINDELNEGENIVAGPYHPALGHLVLSEIYLDSIQNYLLNLCCNIGSDTLVISINPRDLSRFQGQNKVNIQKLLRRFNLKKIELLPDPGIPLRAFSIHGKLFSIFQKNTPYRA